MSDMDALREALPGIWDGILVTLQLTLGGAALAFVIALLLGTVVRVRNLALRGTSRVLIEFFRGTSLLVQIFWLFYVLPLFGYQLEPVFCGILALGLNYGAYGAEVVRGALNAVPRTQWEAAVALNFSPWQRLRKVLFPQAWALMVPPLTNLLIHLLKGTAVASYITLQDLTFEIGKLRQSTGDTLFAFGVGLLIYFALAYVLTVLMNLVETRAKAKLGRGPTLREMLRLAPDEPVEAVAR
ncbi:ectoine/hydroxyectoine ABC transporter permease subunit EhuC [Nocardia cyriacigeorgica]|jgi:polar amino acid transport system permease protein|uniref:ectoine/hydroxyectoine ABC transporter permease subunit EhuC n=1 Tax=Nocardia cyriacigeorgica TaxID=135487 RepID=UPI0013CFD947|nr:ectoine/hydroxyectoine ABC transporter permease subunit EhuC [Nocardia cyriacigeorgica]MBF6436069.1 ectoine/hydroxyectoine ABC transporter permease subunit EhuC [Nocardia cyriacigeorgica]MBF6456944.1 ectoine/hydroxyectoine ABC transporter permease subunit EhuC [Nocardia cyriacigeorgica]MBF6478353.1 ectoine/hydroxyectoine ABC transporter permease subunit EhuC [Nocardia cyriacigeorgica]MBF6551749.1 ectoine/hydroxyectoine ABC transporter permease subunit EhuC [Nocardia cyriacigeorgica]NEW26479